MVNERRGESREMVSKRLFTCMDSKTGCFEKCLSLKPG